MLDDDQLLIASTNGHWYYMGFYGDIIKQRKVFSSYSTGLLQVVDPKRDKGKDSIGVLYSAGDSLGTDEAEPVLIRDPPWDTGSCLVLPAHPTRVVAGRNSNEILLSTFSSALVVDDKKRSIKHQWDLPDAERVISMSYRPERDLYLASTQSNFIHVLMVGQDKPIASQMISNHACYRVIPIDKHNIATSSKQRTKSVKIWKATFDLERMPKRSKYCLLYTSDAADE